MKGQLNIKEKISEVCFKMKSREEEEEIRKPQDDFEWPNMRVIGIPEGMEKGNRKNF